VDANESEDIGLKMVDIKTDLSTFSDKITINMNCSTSDDEEKHEVFEIETLEDVIENEADDTDLVEEQEQEQQEQEQQQHEQQQQQQQQQHQHQDQQSITMREYDLDQLPQFTNSQVQSPPMKKFKITEVSIPPPVLVTPSTSSSSTATDAQNDADMNFLKSLMPDLQQMSPPQKRKFKVTVLNLIDDLLSAGPAEKS
jgi:BESS motif